MSRNAPILNETVEVIDPASVWGPAPARLVVREHQTAAGSVFAVLIERNFGKTFLRRRPRWTRTFVHVIRPHETVEYVTRFALDWVAPRTGPSYVGFESKAA